MNKEVIIHIGAGKSASTYMQNTIFPYLKNVLYFRPFTNHHKKEKKLHPFSSLNKLLAKLLVFHQEKENIRDIHTVKEELNNYINSLDESKILISHEIFVQKPKETAELLKDVFPQAKIFFVIREQSDWLESLYKHAIKTGGYSPPEKALKSTIFKCNWLEIYLTYLNCFRKENVLVLPVEKLKKNEKEFLDDFYNFTGIEKYYPDKKKIKRKSSNIGYSKVSNFIAVKLNKHLNNYWKTLLRDILEKHLDKYFSYFGNEVFDKKYKNFIRIYYEKSNTELEKITGINLGKYGYSLKSEGNKESSNIINTKNYQESIDKLAKKYKDKKVIIYGAGRFFNHIVENYDLSGLNIIAISDKKFMESQDQLYMDYKAICPFEIPDYEPDVILSTLYQPALTYLIINYFLKPETEKSFEWDTLSNV